MFCSLGEVKITPNYNRKQETRTRKKLEEKSENQETRDNKKN